MNKKKILQELARRKANKKDVLANALPQQVEFIKDPAKLKAILATRRASKSYTAGLYLFKEALENPGTTCLYLALTRDSAKKIMVKDVLATINRIYSIGAELNKSELSFTLPNGSVIYLTGADADDEEKEKLLGQKYKLVVIDEAASFKTDQRDLVYKVLKPAMADLQGTIVMIGTPGNNIRSLFFDVTTGKESGWSVYKWKALENKYVAKQIQEEIDELIKANPLIVETALFKQMYLGEWTIETDKLVYKFNSERNLTKSLPITKGEWRYVLGVDLGYEDASAFTVCAYNEYDPNTYIVDTFKKSHMDLTAVANKIKELSTSYPIHKFVVDNAAKQAVEEIKNRFQIPLEPAEKVGKVDFIELMNSELIAGKVKLIEDRTEALSDEWLTLVWDERSATKKENAACPNHLSDSTLYAWRFCYSYMATKFREKPAPQSEEAIEEFWDKEASKLSSNRIKPFWERDFE